MRYTAQVYFNIEGAQIMATCGHKHQLIAKAVECAKWHGVRGASWVVVKVERGRVVQLDSNDVRYLRAACRYHRLQGVEGAI